MNHHRPIGIETKMKKNLQEILGILPILVKDVAISEEKLDNQDYSRRVYVRTLFAMIDGAAYSMKQAVFAITRNLGNPGNLNDSDLVNLKELTFFLDDNGEVREKKKYLRLPDNLKFTIESVNRVLGASIKLGIDTQDWTNFIRSVKIRNNITHPKNLADLVISDKDLECIRSVNSWFNDIAVAMMAALKNFDWGKNVESNKNSPTEYKKETWPTIPSGYNPNEGKCGWHFAQGYKEHIKRSRDIEERQ